MVLFAILMCVNFASCSSSHDDLNEENDNKKTKKLLSSITFYQVEELNEDWNKTIYQFTYNDEKLLSSVTNNRNDLKIDFEWSSGGYIVDVTVTNQGSVKSEGRYWTDNNDFLWRGEGYGTEMDIEYDANGHLDRYILKSYKTTKCKWIWSNDNIAKFEHVYDLTNGTSSLDYEETYTYYLDKENKHPIMDIWYSLYFSSLSLTGYDSFLVMAHPSLLGKCNKNVIKSRNYKNDKHSYNIEYTYEFDSENYPTKITETNTTNGGSRTYTLTWN